jgi:hypothetical protein
MKFRRLFSVDVAVMQNTKQKTKQQTNKQTNKQTTTALTVVPVEGW